MRNSYSISWGNAKATLEFSRSSDAEGFEIIVNELSNINRSGRWWFVVDSITFGVDWPIWWERYQALRNRYRGLLEEDINLRDLKLSAKLKKKEMWRRYDLCVLHRIATCPSVHYPDFFEVSEIIKPELLDGWRERFPSGSFGQYVMSSPPNGRLIDLSDTGDYDQVWSDHQSFFVEHGMLVRGSAIPTSVVAANATNQDLRAFLLRHGIKPSTLRTENELLIEEASLKEPESLADLRKKTIAEHLWCRMPPPTVNWEQLQSYRWLVRGIGCSLMTLFEGPAQLGLAAPEYFPSIQF